MNPREYLACGILVLGSFPCGAEEPSGLEERVAKLELQATEGDPGQGPADVSAWFDGDGLTFSSADGRASVTLGAYVIARSRVFLMHNERDQVDTVEIEETGLHFLATLDESWEAYVHLRILPDGADLYLGHAGFVKWEELQLRAGLLTTPFSMEYDEWVQWVDVPVYSLTSLFDPDSNLGALASGAIPAVPLAWSLGVFNGNGPGEARDENSDKDLIGRVRFVLEESPVGYFMAGVAASAGKARRDTGVTPFEFTAPSTGTTWHADPGLVEFRTDGDLRRAQVQVAWILGPLEVKGEGAVLRAEVDFPDHRAEPFRANSWYLSIGGWLHGSRLPGAVPEVDAPLFRGGPGAFQLVGRVSRTVIDDAFERHAGFTGARRACEISAGVNWYPDRHARISVFYSRYEYSTGRVALDGGTSTDDEDVLVVRAQVDF